MRCFSIIGPSGSGKSALADRLASLGENQQSSTTPAGVNLKSFDFMKDAWFCIDAPGSNEALAHSVNALLVSDTVIICVAADPEQVVLASPYLKSAEASGTPTILFINRIDEPKGRIRDTVSALQSYADHALVLRQIPIREGEKIIGAIDLISERAWRYREGEPSSLIEIPADSIDREHAAHDELLEQLSDFDDWLLEELIEDRQPPSEAVFPIAARMVRENRVMPVLLGSAAHGNGILRLMKALRHEVPDHDALKHRLSTEDGNETPPLAASFHAYYKPGVGKVTLARCLSGSIKQGTKLDGHSLGAILEPVSERSAPNAITAGEVFSAIKSDHLSAPALVDGDRVYETPVWVKSPDPMFEHHLTAENERDEAKLSDAVKKLQECDPGLEISHPENGGGLVLKVQGSLHLRKALETLSKTFKIAVTEEETQPVYRETIAGKSDVHYRHRKQSGGAGQFADVRLSVAPNPRGTGFTFSDIVKGGAVPRNFIPAVEAGAREALSKGPLGFKAIDVDVTLTDGQHHSVDSSDFAFKTAGLMGVQQALSQATPVLLQSIYKVRCHIPSVYSGNLVPLVSSMRGQVLGFDRDEKAKGWDIFRSLLPEIALPGFARSLRAETQGIGYFEKEFDHFEELYGKEAEQIIGRGFPAS